MSRERLLVGFAFGAGLLTMVALSLVAPHAPTVQAADDKPEASVASLQAELDQLKKLIADAAGMTNVDEHAQNLWFAGKAQNWPLADYYWKKTLLHMRVSAAMHADAEGEGEKQDSIRGIMDAIQKSPHMQVGQTIEQRDLLAFSSAYRRLLEGCYACHKAVDKPYLRPRMPVSPHQAIITIDPNADWPK